MKAVWFCFLLSISATIASPLTEVQNDVNTENESRSPALEAIINNLLEDLRDTIFNGSEDIPVLDPLVIDELQLDDETIPLPGAKISIADATVRNLGSFVIDRLSVTVLLLINRVSIEAHIPVIDVDVGHYDLTLDALGFSIFGAGTAKIQIINPSITVDLTIRPSFTGGGLTVSDCTVFFSLGGFEPEITGMFGHDGASDFVGLFLQNLIPELVVMYENEISDVLSEIVREVVDNALPGIFPI